VYITVDIIIKAASLITACGVILGIVLFWLRWYLKNDERAKDIEIMKKEQCLLTYGVLACLKGLKEQGCNGPVTEAINKIEKHLNQQAHDQE